MTMSRDNDNACQFTGDGEPQVTIRKGPQQWGITNTQEHFKDAQWTFYADGRFLFMPSALIRLKKDLQPMTGTYSLQGSAIEFTGLQQLSPSASTSLDGTIRLQGEQILLHAVYTLTSHIQLIALIQQQLSQGVAAPSPLSAVAYGGVMVPSVFKIALQGKVDAHAFGPLPGTLKIMPNAARLDTNPFMVELTMDDPNSLGAIYWTSFLPYIDNQGELISEIKFLSDGQMCLTVTCNQNRLSPSWSTLLSLGERSSLREEIPIGAWAIDGTLLLSLQDDALSGEIHARGCSYAHHPDTGPFSIYDAQLTGKR